MNTNSSGTLAPRKKRKKNKKTERRIRQVETLTTGLRVPDGYEIRTRGLYSDDANGRVTDAPIWVKAVISDPDGRNQALLVEGLDRDGNVVRVEVSFDMIYGSASVLATQLSSAGLRVRYGMAKHVAYYINVFRTTITLIRVTQPGWVGNPLEKPVFALRDRVIGGDNYDVTRLMENNLLRGLESQGDLDTWTEQVAVPAGKHPVVAVSLFVPFASVLVKLLGAESFGVLLRGPSSTGKTSAAMAAASVFGRPTLGSTSLMLTYNTTTNALEEACESRNDLGMCIDEVGMFDTGAFTTLVYRVAGGQRKGRLGRDGNLRRGASWSFVFLSTGERSVEEMLSEDNRQGRVRAGQMVRMLNVETNSDIIRAESVEDAKQAVHDLREAVSTNFGTAGPAYVERLIEAMTGGHVTASELVEEWNLLTNELMVPDLEVHQQRAVRHLAALALGGHLAAELEILPYDRDEILDMVKVVRDMYFASGSTSDGAVAARRLRDYISDNMDRFVYITSPTKRNHYLSHEKWRIRNSDYFLFGRRALCDAANVNDPHELLTYLRDHEIIHQNNGEKKFQSKVPQFVDDGDEDYRSERSGRQRSLYCIGERILEWLDDDPHPPKSGKKSKLRVKKKD